MQSTVFMGVVAIICVLMFGCHVSNNQLASQMAERRFCKQWVGGVGSVWVPCASVEGSGEK